MGIERKSYLPQEAGPKIRYSDEFIKSGFPYKIDIHKEALIQLMKTAGVSEEKIDSFTLIFQRRKMLAHAYYSTSRNTAYVNVNKFGEDIQKRLKKAWKISSSGKKPLVSGFIGMYSGKRLGKYLSVAPQERGLLTAERLIRRAEEREFERDIAHEVSHASDTEKSAYSTFLMKRVFGIGGFALGVDIANTSKLDFHDPALNIARNLAYGIIFYKAGSSIGYLSDPWEIKARLFTWRKKKEIPHFVSITPKQRK